eukprot:CAMPEP_0198290782 /NCGR_PEP_ID=MMETSP1449-20131203/8522_1 /TAXON_ID=420275 /ORGANISM="Attheya septentrionalis, Strain CCMP2084" /LENGTH=524 /DNA_ID=CAMNT_0043989327 /DNA_START=72 /DNA_END=1647 /DNA_ORIENTATION=-
MSVRPLDAIMLEREREGRCPLCGTQTHTFTGDTVRQKVALDIEGQILRGRCLFCVPLPTHTTGLLEVSQENPEAAQCNPVVTPLPIMASVPLNNPIQQPQPEALETEEYERETSQAIGTASLTRTSSKSSRKRRRLTPQTGSRRGRNRMNQATPHNLTPSREPPIDIMSREIRDIISSAKINSSRACAQDSACKKLRKIAAESDTDRKKIMKENGIDMIVEAMRLHPLKTNVVVEACGALSNLALLESAHEEIVKKEGLDKIVQAMNVHKSQMYIQVMCCEAMRHLSASKDGKDSVISLGAMDSVITAMRKYQTNAQIQEHGCAFLQNMALLARARSDMIKLKTEMSLVLCVALRNRGNQDVPITACQVIRNLAAKQKTKNMLIESSTIPTAMLHLLQEEDEMLAKAACGALLYIVTNSKVGQGTIIQKNGIAIIIAAMEKFKDSLDFRQIGNTVLEELASMNSAAGVEVAVAVEVVEKGGVDVIVRAMDSHSMSVSIQELACGGIQKLKEIEDAIVPDFLSQL